MRPEEDLAIAVFGSVARGDADAISDRDVLIITDDAARRRSVAARWQRGGWHPTSYGWARLSQQVRRGALFAHHLRLEARRINDPQDRLASLLAGTPDGDFATTFRESRDLLRVLEAIPNSPEGYLWAFDVLAVAFRGMAVAHLATVGRYAFGTADLAGGLRETLSVVGCRQLIQLLRGMKAAHRTGRRVQIARRRLFSAIEAVDRAFHVGMQARVAGSDQVVDRALQSARTAGWYSWSRQVEAGLLAVDTAASSAHARSTLETLRRLVSNPTVYGGMLACRPQEVNGLLVELFAGAGTAIRSDNKRDLSGARVTLPTAA